MAKMKVFRAAINTPRFKKGQRIWILDDLGNSFFIKYKLRGKKQDRYKTDTLDKYYPNKPETGIFNPIIGSQKRIKESEVTGKRALYFGYRGKTE